MHRSSGRWQLGLLLALITSSMWGLLPIAVEILLKSMDPWTITFYRFFGATLIIGLYLIKTRQLPSLKKLSPMLLILLSIAILGLCANYIFFLLGLPLAKAATTQVLIQVAPMLLLFGGLFFFKEQFSRLQWLGFSIFLIGLGLFFNHRLASLLSLSGDYALGVFYIFIAAITWAAYALAQKQLLKNYSSLAIIFMILTVGSIGFLPVSQVSQIFELDNFNLWLLLFASLNTAIAYGCFAEALAHWEASRVSAILSITPVITVICLEILSSSFPTIFSMEPLSWLTLSGMLIVVAGSMVTALGKSSQKSQPDATHTEKNNSTNYKNGSHLDTLAKASET